MAYLWRPPRLLGWWMPARSSACSPRHNPYRWHLPVTPGISTRLGFLFGGSGLGAAIEAMEGTTGRRCVGDGAVPRPTPGRATVMDIDVTVAVEGHQITQARAVGHVGERRDPHRQRRARRAPARSGKASGREMPGRLPAPDDCPPRPAARADRRVDQRRAST